MIYVEKVIFLSVNASNSQWKWLLAAGLQLSLYYKEAILSSRCRIAWKHSLHLSIFWESSSGPHCLFLSRSHNLDGDTVIYYHAKDLWCNIQRIRTLGGKPLQWTGELLERMVSIYHANGTQNREKGQRKDNQRDTLHWLQTKLFLNRMFFKAFLKH